MTSGIGHVKHHPTYIFILFDAINTIGELCKIYFINDSVESKYLDGGIILYNGLGLSIDLE